MPRPRIPAEFRRGHRLYVKSRYYAGGGYAGSRVYRAGGSCSCGEMFGLRVGDHTMDRAEVIEAHKDHVVEAWESMAMRGGK